MRRLRPSLSLRAFFALAGILALVAAMALPATALAKSGGGTVPGNNGTVKIHEGGLDGDQSGGSLDIDNDPHVCTFHLHFFFADAGQAGTWWIESWPPTGDGTVVLSGSYLTGANGEFRTPPSPDFYTLPNGHYKLFWEGRNDKNIKHKVFWVACETTPTPTPTSSQEQESMTPTPTETETATPTATESETATPTATESETATPTATESETATPTATESETATPTATESETATPTATESETATPTSSEETETMTPTPTQSEEQASSTPEESVGGVTAAPGGTPPPTSSDSSNGPDQNSSLRLALFGIAMFLFAMTALAPKMSFRTRK